MKEHKSNCLKKSVFYSVMQSIKRAGKGKQLFYMVDREIRNVGGMVIQKTFCVERRLFSQM